MNRSPGECDETALGELLENVDNALAEGRSVDELRDGLRGFGAEAAELIQILELLRRPARAGSTWDEGRSATAAISTRDADATGHLFGKFHILGWLGAGGGGVVLQAQDVRTHREVALKVPWPGGSDTIATWRRFIREARAAAALDHPNIVPIYETGEVDGVQYIASAFCEGPDLATWLATRETPVPLGAAARWIADLARAVRHAHERGVVHRDIKPSNILLQLEHQSGVVDQSASNFTPRLTDFGLAQWLGEDGSITASGVVLGTFKYMSPEQAAGRTADIGPATDIYALGAVLYELICGKPPIDGETDVITLRRIGVDEPRAMKTLRSDVPAELEAICFKCLHANAAQRYPTAGDLADDLERFLAGTTVRARGPSAIRRVFRASRGSRRNGVVTVASVLFVGNLLAVTIAFLSSRPHEAARRLQPDQSATVSRVFSSSPSEGYLDDVKRANLLWTEAADSGVFDATIPERMTEVLSRHIPSDGERDERGFAWHYLWRQSHPAEFTPTPAEVAALQGHQDDVYCVRFSPGEHLLASASADKTVRIWDVNTGRELHTLRGHDGAVNTVDFSPDGKWVASGGDHRRVKVWDMASGKELRTFRDHGNMVLGVAFAPVQPHLASVSDDGELRIRDTTTFDTTHVIPAHAATVQSLAYTSDGRWLVTCGNDRTAKVWDTRDYSLRKTHRFDVLVNAAAVCPGSELLGLMLGTEKTHALAGRVALFDLLSGEHCASFPKQSLGSETVAFSHDGRLLATTGGPGHVLLWNVATQTVLAHWKGHRDLVWFLTFSTDSTRLVSSGRDGAIRVWDISRRPEATLLPASSQRIKAFAFSPNNSELVIGRNDPRPLSEEAVPTLEIWNVAGREPWLDRSRRSRDRVMAASYTENGRTLAISDGDGIAFIDPQTLEEKRRIGPIGQTIQTMAISRDNRYLAISCGVGGIQDWTLQLWDLQAGKSLDSIAGDPYLGTLSFSTDGRSMATMNAGQVVLYDIVDDRLRKKASLHCPVKLNHCQFLETADSLALACADGTVRVWDVGSDRQVSVYRGSEDPLTQVACSGDGRTLAALCANNCVYVWKRTHWEALLRLPAPRLGDRRLGLSISHNGQTIAGIERSPHGANRVVLWDLTPTDVVAEPKRTLLSRQPK